MSRETLRARNTREPSCRACGYWRSDATHLPAADCPEQPCAKPDEHHAYDGPESAVWDEEIAALLALADAVAEYRAAREENDALSDEWIVSDSDTYPDALTLSDERMEAATAALGDALAAVEALP